MDNETLFIEIYTQTEEYGRNQFVREIMELRRENKQLQQDRNKYKSIVDELKEFAEEEKSKVSKNCGVRTYRNKIAPYIKMLFKIKELEEGNSNE